MARAQGWTAVPLSFLIQVGENAFWDREEETG